MSFAIPLVYFQPVKDPAVIPMINTDILHAPRSTENITMGKTKSAKPDMAAKVSKDAQVKSLSSVKQGAVTKPSQTSKSKSKDVAKEVATKADKANKKSKKAKKEPTPVPVSESEDSASSQSSDDDSEAEAAVPEKAGKTNGVGLKGASKAESDSDGESSSSDSSEDEATVPEVNGTTQKAAKSDEESDTSDSSANEATASKAAPAAAAKAVAGAKEESGSDDSSEEESDEEEDKNVGATAAVNAKTLNGKLEKVASKEVRGVTSGIGYNLLTTLAI